MEWTKEVEASVQRNIAAAEENATQLGIEPTRVVISHEAATAAVAEIERLNRVLANHKAILVAAESAGREVCDERDTARAELHVCGLELQTCRATLEEERRDGDGMRLEIERLTTKLAGIQGVAAESDGMMMTISEQAAQVARLSALFAKWAPLLSPHLNGEQLADLRGDVVRAVDASRQGLTEEQALATAGPLSRDIYNRIGLATGNKIGAPEWMRDAIAAALLRASREHVRLPPGDVSIPRVVLERLAKAAESDPDAREARWAAERILQQATLAAEPARTDPLCACVLAEATQIGADRGAK